MLESLAKWDLLLQIDEDPQNICLFRGNTIKSKGDLLDSSFEDTILPDLISLGENLCLGSVSTFQMIILNILN